MSVRPCFVSWNVIWDMALEPFVAHTFECVLITAAVFCHMHATNWIIRLTPPLWPCPKPLPSMGSSGSEWQHTWSGNLLSTQWSWEWTLLRLRSVKRTKNWNPLATLVSPYFVIELKIALCKHPTLSCYYIQVGYLWKQLWVSSRVPMTSHPWAIHMNLWLTSTLTLHIQLLPTASTCALQLTLPTCYPEYVAFKRALDTAFTMHGGFGMSWTVL